MRQTHHWAALVFVAAMVAPRRVFFTGAFRKPRAELGDRRYPAGRRHRRRVHGVLAPRRPLSGTGLRIIYSAVLSIPVVGTWLAFLLFGGEFPSPELIRACS